MLAKLSTKLLVAMMAAAAFGALVAVTNISYAQPPTATTMDANAPPATDTAPAETAKVLTVLLTCNSHLC